MAFFFSCYVQNGVEEALGVKPSLMQSCGISCTHAPVRSCLRVWLISFTVIGLLSCCFIFHVYVQVQLQVLLYSTYNYTGCIFCNIFLKHCWTTENDCVSPLVLIYNVDIYFQFTHLILQAVHFTCQSFYLLIFFNEYFVNI